MPLGEGGPLMQIARVASIDRYPVKSMAGESLDSVDVLSGGLPGDRAWAVRDEKRGGIRGAKKIPGLMQFAATYAQPPGNVGSSPAAIVFPDGSRAGTGDADIHQRLSAALDHPVTLWPLLPADALDHYRRGAPTHEDFEQELREIFGRTPDEPLPDLTVFPPEVFEFESPPGTYFDVAPLLLLTENSLASLQARVPGSHIDRRRFRPNLTFTDMASDEPFPEFGWNGKRLRVGDAVLEVGIACPRCVMITLAQPGLDKDPAVMRAVVREAGGNFGVYASVAQPGRVRIGDVVQLLD